MMAESTSHPLVLSAALLDCRALTLLLRASPSLRGALLLVLGPPRLFLVLSLPGLRLSSPLLGGPVLDGLPAEPSLAPTAEPTTAAALALLREVAGRADLRFSGLTTAFRLGPLGLEVRRLWRPCPEGAVRRTELRLLVSGSLVGAGHCEGPPLAAPGAENARPLRGERPDCFPGMPPVPLARLPLPQPSLGDTELEIAGEHEDEARAMLMLPDRSMARLLLVLGRAH